MQATKRETVEVQVEARNRLNTLALQYQQELSSILQPYLGKKVRKVSGYGGWVKALEAQVHDLDRRYREQGIRVHCVFSVTRFWAELSYSYKLKDSGVTRSLTESVWLGYCCTDATYSNDEQPAGVLTQLADKAKDLRTDWTADEVIDLRNQIECLQHQLRELDARHRNFDR
jgi:hypothetical protein